MRKLLLFALTVIALRSFAFSPPDEGMWLPMFVERLNWVDIQKMGLQLSAQELYDINNSSLKDAIAGLSGDDGAPGGYFCTGEMVSKQGLMFTNHHCGYDAIQKHSTVDHDYLTDGFWAMRMEEELPNEGMTASFLVRMDDVTSRVLEGITDTTPDQTRSKKIREMLDKISKEAEEDGKYQAVVKGFYSGNEYYLFVYQTFKDVRLVGAPPSGIGKFGGDTDNWMWPRHTGDFCIFRVYCAPDGKPADYAKENVPYEPKHFLPVSLKGVTKDDFAMIWGFPGTTQRYMTSFGVEYTLNHMNPALIKLLGKKLEIWKEAMDNDKGVRIKYSSKYANYANGWKNFIGENRGIKRLKVADKKREIESRFLAWAGADAKRKEKYGEALGMIEKAYSEQAKVAEPLFYTMLGLYRGAEVFDLVQGSMGLYGAIENKKKDPEGLKAAVEEMRESVKTFYKDYDAAVDQQVMAELFAMCYRDVAHEMLPAILPGLAKKYKGDFNAWASEAFKKSIFTSEAKINAFLDNPKLKTLAKDPLYVVLQDVFGHVQKVSGKMQGASKNKGKGDRLFIAGLREMDPGKKYYPDANSTMRFTYGKVLDYYPADAVHYDYVTHAYGIMEKEDPSNEEFIVPEKLQELIAKKDFGPYGANGDLVVCFLTTNDITGGNSGSPVLNGKGELIGLAFDGNWEAMSGNIAFEQELQRTICVDIRYVLFVIDKYAGAKNLINELTIRN
ncbi:MAG TPA: S46 family peptidase [Bacteroidales bacterium]|nr:S46 family peptidase [Bacteroidales bacterium]HSA43122.1 S46 family peptidase [Bacteroidales bacterium]